MWFSGEALNEESFARRLLSIRIEMSFLEVMKFSAEILAYLEPHSVA